MAESVIVGRIGGGEILLADIEAPNALQLHDLALRRFRMLRRSLLTAALSAVASPDAAATGQLALEPPSPPRLPVEADSARVRPAGDAPVTVLAFCNFESPHCARLQIKLADVLPLFGNAVRFAHRDLPLPFHRSAGTAAEAARCALEQGNYWRFHDALYAGSGPLDRARLERAGRAALLDAASFDACVDSRRRAEDIAADAALAAALGVATVPAVFVNGLYAGQEVEPGELIWLIEQELARLGVRSPREDRPTRDTTVPMILRALLYSEHPGQGLALLSPIAAPERREAFGEGEAVTQSVVIERINRDDVELLNAGVPERLAFGGQRRDGEAGSPVGDAQEPAVVTPHRAVPMTLDRNEVVSRLVDRAGLEETLATVPMTAGGYRQLRITDVQPGSLYALLELQPGDVLLGVNEQPVHEASNPLWDALEREDEVRVRVMRRGGVPQHYTYRFDERP